MITHGRKLKKDMIMRMTDVCTLLTKKLYNDGKENDHEKNFNDMFVSGVVFHQDPE